MDNTLADDARAAADAITAEYGDNLTIKDLIAIAYMRGNVAGIREALAKIKLPIPLEAQP